MKKVIYSLVFLGIVVGACFLLWNKRSLLSKQPVLNNRQYGPLLDSIKAEKKVLRKQKATPAVLEKKFISWMTTRIFPYWYGTKWDFYGTTETPNEGSIACGYFVTTTLRDMGVPLNRVKLACCASEEMIRSLVSKPHIHHLSNMDLRTFESRLEKIGNGLYIVGLDNHTGFLLVTPGENYFIHSSGAYPFQVVKDVLSESAILMKSNYRVVGKISSDKAFLQRWVEHE